MFFDRKPLTPITARNAAILNLVATPGLGTIMVGAVFSGLAQLSLALAGFAFVIVWFFVLMRQYYGQITGDVEIKPVAWIGLIGAILFVAAWVWSLVTSIGLIRKARRAAPAIPVPPLISP